MRPVERFLLRHGYIVLNLGYPSRSADVRALADHIALQIDACEHDGPLDFVTHSLGGILLRQAVASGALANHRVHRAVMLGPPNTGSELADRLQAMPVFGASYRRFTGPAGAQLGTDEESVPARLPPVSFQTGIIAGTRSYNPFFSALLGAPNDGKVRVERTRVSGMQDFIALPYWHPLLMLPATVHRQLLHFLATGQFEHEALGERPSPR
jgi:triacylglycerol lipase